MIVRGRGQHVASWRALSALALAAAIALSAASEAHAKREITTGVAGELDYISSDDALVDLWFDRTAEANADLARIDLQWRRVVGGTRPENPRDPADPAYDFSRLDPGVRAAEQRGMEVLFTVARAPDWAEGPNRPDAPILEGSWRPDPVEYGNFATALARRYSGTFAPPGQPPLPRVRYFEAWNEPNQDPWIAPQWVGDRPEGPAIYRQLLNSFYDAVKGVDQGNTVISGGLLSFGSPREDPVGENRIRPVHFLRELFCLEGRKELKPRPGCPKVKFDVLGHHPITFEKSATYSAIDPDDAAMADFDRLERVLRAAENAGVVGPGGKRPIWATEFWWISKPPSIPSTSHLAVSERKHARLIEEALYMFWKQRVSTAIQYLIRDDPRPDNLYKTGLFFADGERKLAFRAFQFPFVTDPLRGKRVRTWGRSPKAGKVKIQSKKRGGWKTVKRTRVREDAVFTAKLHGTNQMRARIDGEKSLVW